MDCASTGMKNQIGVMPPYPFSRITTASTPTTTALRSMSTGEWIGFRLVASQRTFFVYANACFCVCHSPFQHVSFAADSAPCMKRMAATLAWSKLMAHIYIYIHASYLPKMLRKTPPYQLIGALVGASCVSSCPRSVTHVVCMAQT